jgi:hypothetical protein
MNSNAQRRANDFGPARFVANPLANAIELGDEMLNLLVPGNLPRRHEELKKFHARNLDLRARIQSQEEGISRLRPLAERYEHIYAG